MGNPIYLLLIKNTDMITLDHIKMWMNAQKTEHNHSYDTESY